MKRDPCLPNLWSVLKRALRRESRVLLTSLGVASGVIVLRLFGLLQAWELATLDLAFRLRPLEPIDDRIVIVGINEADLRRVGKWPLPDAIMAQLIEKLKTYQPRVIGLDIYRDLPVEPGHAALTKVFQSTPNLIGIEQIQDKTSLGIPAPSVLTQRNQVGFNNLVFDLDGKVRREILYWWANGKQHTSLALTLALAYLQAEGITEQAATTNPSYLQLGNAVFQRFEPNTGSYVTGDAGGYQILANLRGPAKRFSIISLSDVLEGRIGVDRLRNRVVLIGSTATSLKDYFYTSYSSGASNSASPEPTAGVELQANFISQIISAALDRRPLIQVWSDLIEWLWIFGWAWLGASLSWGLRSPHRSIGLLVLAALSLAGIAYGAFLASWWLPLVPAEMALASSAIGIITYLAYLEEELKRSKEFLNTIINTIPDPIFVKDRQHRWVVLNDAFCKLVGYDIQDLIDKSDYEVFPYHEADVFRQQDRLIFTTAHEQEHEETFTDRYGVTHLIETKRSLHKDAAGNQFLVGVIRDITERKHLEEELKRTAAELVRFNAELKQSADHLQHQATHDHLTGLPNRKLFYDRLQQSIEWANTHSQLVALLFLDLDGFKQVNDTLGHDVGDLLLKAVADRLSRCLRSSDTVSRLGGDEFTVILPAIPSVQQASSVAEKILVTLSHPYKFGTQVLNVTTSIGISIYPHDGEETELLLKEADNAMYHAKELGKNCYQFASKTARP